MPLWGQINYAADLKKAGYRPAPCFDILGFFVITLENRLAMDVHHDGCNRFYGTDISAICSKVKVLNNVISIDVSFPASRDRPEQRTVHELSAWIVRTERKSIHNPAVFAISTATDAPIDPQEHRYPFGWRLPAVPHDEMCLHLVPVQTLERAGFYRKIRSNLSFADAASFCNGVLSHDICLPSLFSRSNSRLGGDPGKVEREGHEDNANAGYNRASNTDKKHAVRPYSHFLLGLQVIVGSIGVWIGLSNLIKAHDKRRSDEMLEVLEALINISCLCFSYLLALSGFFPLISFYLGPSLPS